NCTFSSVTNRFEPDIAADADPATGAQVYYTDNTVNPPAHTFSPVGGTSLAAPLWAGMAVVADRYAAQNSLARIGWAAPKIYALAANATKYGLDFHDVPAGGTINGSILYPTGPGWDEATGWGSIDWWNWVRDMVGVPGAQTVTIPIAAGWSFITLPLSPTTPLDAQTVLTSLLAQTHGGYAEIDAYAASRFSPSLYDDQTDHLGIGGTNFTLQLGHGYALYSDTAGSLSVTGSPVAAQAVTLAAGWNLVGFPDAATNPVKADDFLSALLAQTHGGYAEIDGYASSRFTPSAYDDPHDGLGLGGTNFTVQPGQGYALYTDTGTTQAF
ncbi:MAG TPA: hypothetical protein VNL71_24810, partial [Chloroflexota bacterium]|nr:hypothetical protein [Chloroflexota bacterium]